MDGEDIRATGSVSECKRNRHLAAHRRVGRLELHHLDDRLIRYELNEAAVVGIGVGGCLAGPGRRIVSEQDTERKEITISF